jgi:pyridoxal phosphate enzyme (YggS family)
LPAAIREAYSLGINHFGENYYQEALAKMTALEDLAICWHFIGPLQSNKVEGIAKHFDWVHSLSRQKIAKALNDYRPPDKPPLLVCLQVKLLDDPQKSGINLDEVAELATEVSELPYLKLRGLMTMLPLGCDESQAYALFVKLSETMQHLNQTLNLAMDTLSMGMSADIKPAIHAGATIVRVGRAIFGERGI